MPNFFLISRKIIKNVLFVFVIGLVSVCLYLYLQDKEDNTFFSNELSQAYADVNIEVNGIEYKVKNGEVSHKDVVLNKKDALPILQVAYGVLLAERDPLYVLPEVDVDKLDDAIEMLSLTKQKLVDFQSSETDKDLVREALYPIGFLRSLADRERLRQVLITTPSDQNLLAYLETDSVVTETFANDLTNFRDAFVEVVPENTIKYGTLAGVVSREQTLKSIDELIEMNESVKKKLQDRDLCIDGDVSSCEADNLKIVALEQAETKMSGQSLDLAKDILHLLTLTKNDRSDYTNAKIIELDRTVCTQSVTVPSVFATHEYRFFDNTIIADYVRHIGEIFFNDVDTLGSEISFFEHYRKNDIKYVVWNPMSHYKCPVFGADMSKVLSVFKVYETVKEEPLSSYLHDKEPESEELKALELKLLTSEPLLEEDVLLYLNEAHKILEHTQNPALAKAIAKLSLLFTTNSVGLDQFIYRIASVEDQNLQLAEKGVPIEHTAPFLFYVRSGFFTLFLGEQEHPNNYTPPHTETNLQAKPIPLIRYSEIRESVSQSKLISDMIFNLRLHNL